MDLIDITVKRPGTKKSWFHFWQYAPWADEELPFPEGYPYTEWRLYDKCHYWTMAEVDFTVDVYTIIAHVRGEKYQLTSEGWIYTGKEPGYTPALVLGVDE